MIALEWLMREHRAIERVLVSIDGIADIVQAGVEPPPFFDAILAFIRSQADELHHAKEEGILFEAMAARGLPGNAGPIGCMLHDHTLLRGLSRRMSASLPAARRGERLAVDSLLASARLYARALAQHIVKEDHMLYPLATRVLPASALEEMLVRFGEVDPEGIAAFDAAATNIERLTRSWVDDLDSAMQQEVARGQVTGNAPMSK